jgi:hypothetical protein
VVFFHPVLYACLLSAAEKYRKVPNLVRRIINYLGNAEYFKTQTVVKFYIDFSNTFT